MPGEGLIAKIAAGVASGGAGAGGAAAGAGAAGGLGIGGFLAGLSNPLILGLIFGGSAIFNMIGAASQRKQAKGYQDYFWGAMQGTEMDMRKSIESRQIQYNALAQKLGMGGYDVGGGGLQSPRPQVRDSRSGY